MNSLSPESEPTAARTIHPFSLPPPSSTPSSRVDIPEIKGWTARAFLIDNLLSPEDCRYNSYSLIPYSFLSLLFLHSFLFIPLF
jgi:hypothetical protein